MRDNDCGMKEGKKIRRPVRERKLKGFQLETPGKKSHPTPMPRSGTCSENQWEMGEP